MTEEATSINAAAVRLPPFSPNQPLTWFRRAERHFHLKKITNSTTKADYAIEVLPESVFQHIASWLDTQPAEIQYEDLKAALLRTFCPSPSVRARRILDLPHQLPGDCTPTQTWHNINTLCQLPELDATTGLPKQLDLVKEIWLMCLTPQVRSSLSDTDNRNIEVLVKEAEERHDAHQAAALSHPVSQNINLTTVRQYGNQPTASTTTDNDTPTAGHFICWYHRRYGDNARKCSQGCQYQSKNCITGCV